MFLLLFAYYPVFLLLDNFLVFSGHLLATCVNSFIHSSAEFGLFLE